MLLQLRRPVVLWAVRPSIAMGSQEVALPFYSALVRCHLKWHVQLWAPQHRRDILESPAKDHDDGKGTGEPLLGVELETAGAVWSGKEKETQQDLINVYKLELHKSV